MAAAAVMNKSVFSVRLPNEASIFSAEAKAFELAFEHIKMSKDTHTLSCLQSIHSISFVHPFILDIFYSYYCVSNRRLLDSNPYWCTLVQ